MDNKTPFSYISRLVNLKGPMGFTTAAPVPQPAEVAAPPSSAATIDDPFHLWDDAADAEDPCGCCDLLDLLIEAANPDLKNLEECRQFFLLDPTCSLYRS